MQRNTQLFTHQPELGIFGDCHRTAISCVLNLDPKQVPHPTDPEIWKHVSVWAQFYETWLNSQGLTIFTVWYDVEFSFLLEMLSEFPNTAFIVGGKTSRETAHSIVVYRGEVWDPHPSRAGLTEQFPPGWQVSVIAKLT